MKNILSIIPMAILILLASCEKPVFIPVQGEITGIVRDNNGFPLEGVTVTANFDPPESSSGIPIPGTVTSLTTTMGTYRLEEVWDLVELSINHPGFQPVFERVELKQKNRRTQINFKLIGSPTVQSVMLSKNVLALDTPDTLLIQMEAQDPFNSSFGTYSSHLLIQNNAGQTALILTATLSSQSQTQYIFEAELNSGLLPAGIYRVVAEVIDPDGNGHQAIATEEIRVE